MFLDSIPPLEVCVGYGELGTQGALGYENKPVAVQRQTYAHALSSHPPARLVYSLDGRFRAFRCQVAINDDVSAGASHADFRVLADGRRVAFKGRARGGTKEHFIKSVRLKKPQGQIDVAEMNGIERSSVIADFFHFVNSISWYFGNGHSL